MTDTTAAAIGDRPIEDLQSRFRALPRLPEARGETVGGDATKDSLDLSPGLRRLAARDLGEVLPVENRGAAGRLIGVVQRALAGIRQDVAQVLGGFGIDNTALNGFLRDFSAPIREALQSGVSFQGSLSLAAFTQVTEVSASSFSQSTNLVAHSIEIDVNRDTGEVNLAVASLRFEERLEITSRSEPAPLLVLGPGALPPPDAAEEEETPIEQLLREAQEVLVLSGYIFSSEITINAVEDYEDDDGVPHTRLDVTVRAPLEEEQAEDTAEESVDLSV